MGIGMVVITSSESVSSVHAHANACGIESFEIGSIVPGSGNVVFAGMQR